MLDVEKYRRGGSSVDNARTAGVALVFWRDQWIRASCDRRSSNMETSVLCFQGVARRNSFQALL
jgi:hypothetical protein